MEVLIIINIVVVLGIAGLLCAIFLRNDKRKEEERIRNNEEYEKITRLYESQINFLQQSIDRQNSELRTQVKLEFENLATLTLDREKERLEKENLSQLGNLINPLRVKLEEFNRNVTDSYVKENATRKSLSDQIDRLVTLNHNIGEEARNLANALKGNSKIQGDWGETILETLLERAGLKKDINYTMQLTQDESGRALRDDDGKLRRPDVVVFLPENHKIIIDSKVTLTSFVDLQNADTEKERAAAKLRLVESVRRHVIELGSKNYSRIVKNSADHVLMFIPNEGAYFAALGADAELWEFAYRHNVVIVSPTHLFSVMQLVDQLWRGDRQNRNAGEIARLGGLIYDKIAAFTKEMDSIHKGINQAESAYQKCVNNLTNGPTSVMARTRRLKELGAKTSSMLSGSIEQAIDQNLNQHLTRDVKNEIGDN